MYRIFTRKRGAESPCIQKMMRVMQLSTVLLIATMMQVSASGFAQRITFSAKQGSLQELFKAIKVQTGYNVVISAERLESAKPITVVFKNTPLTEVLESTLSKQNLAYTIEKNTIVIKEKEASLLDKTKSAILNLFQDLKGRVTDEQGKPLPNASIRIKGTNVVKNTDENGEFEIKDVAEDDILLVSYIGYKTLEIPVKGATMPLEIKLNAQTGELEEVKVVYNTGYQELNKERSTGSFVQIDNELFNRAVGTNVLDRILNVTSGLINNPTGEGGG